MVSCVACVLAGATPHPLCDFQALAAFVQRSPTDEPERWVVTQVCKACQVEMSDEELRQMAAGCDAGNGRASVDKLSLALRRWQLHRVNEEPYNNPRTRLYSPTPRVHHEMPSRTVVVPPSSKPVWPTATDDSSQVRRVVLSCVLPHTTVGPLLPAPRCVRMPLPRMF